MDGPRQKVCSRCKRLLPTTEFYLLGRGGHGRGGPYQAWCKWCKAQARQTYRVTRSRPAGG